MSNTLVDLYMQDINVIAKTMVMHHIEIAEHINKQLELRFLNYHVDQDRPETWKYYMNLAGEYHETDLALIREINGDGNPYMTIKVAGDNEAIVTNFTKDLISGDNADIALATEYAYGSNFYTELVSRYPEHESLILGILNPIDKSLALKAYNRDILYIGGYYRVTIDDDPDRYYFVERIRAGLTSRTLIEANEVSLIPKLESYIKNTADQWFVPDHAIANDLYIIAFNATLYSRIPRKIANLREANIKTPEAHSFHVREYLNSHGDLGKHLPYLTLQQSMYLYQNMRWLEDNVGKEFAFMDVVEHLLTPAGVPIAAYILKHNLYELSLNAHVDPYMERQALNFQSLGSGSNQRSIEEIVLKSINLARDNGLYTEDQIQSIIETSRRGRINELDTKVLESDMQDTRDSITYSKAAFLLNTWLYTVKHGTYQGSIFITHPITGARMQFTPLNSFILMYYCFCMGFCDTKLEYMPHLKARIIPKTHTPPYPELKPFPTKQELKWTYDSKYITDNDIAKLQQGTIPSYKYSSASDFNTNMTRHHGELMRRWTQAIRFEDRIACGQMEHLVNRHYWFDVDCGQLTDQPMETWLRTHGLELDALSTQDFRNLANDLIKKGTGTTEHDGDWLSEMQGAVLDILQYFSSYTIQIIKTFRSGKATKAGQKSLRFSNIIDTVKTVDYIDITKRMNDDYKLWVKLGRIEVGKRRVTSFDNMYAYEKVHVGISPRRHDLVVESFKRRVEIAKLRIRATNEYKIPAPFTLEAVLSDPIHSGFTYEKAAGLEIGNTSMVMDNPFVLYHGQSEQIPALGGYQSIPIDTNTTFEDYDMVYKVDLLGVKSDPIKTNLMYQKAAGLEYGNFKMTADLAYEYLGVQSDPVKVEITYQRNVGAEIGKTEMALDEDKVVNAAISSRVRPELTYQRNVGVEPGNTSMAMDLLQDFGFVQSETVYQTFNVIILEHTKEAYTRALGTPKVDNLWKSPATKLAAVDETAPMFISANGGFSSTGEVTSFILKFFGSEQVNLLAGKVKSTPVLKTFTVAPPPSLSVYAGKVKSTIVLTSLAYIEPRQVQLDAGKVKATVSLTLMTIG